MWKWGAGERESSIAMGRGTEAFPDLGEHCEHEDCNQLDFLPFTCDGCNKVFCLEHRTYKGHDCPNGEQHSRIVVVCEDCSMSMEKMAGEEAAAVLERHRSSGSCDPARKRKAKCPVKRCREALTFSNTSTCHVCNLRTCLRHRYASDHGCKPLLGLPPAARNGVACRGKNNSLPPSPPSIRAY